MRRRLILSLLCIFCVVSALAGCGVYSDVEAQDPCAQRIPYPYTGTLKADYEKKKQVCEERVAHRKEPHRVFKTINF